ncbi:hypothetical protein HELRODRAFT_94284 [Helobdella robusta]|uniref:Uncharacterized protein n=1 Tax=Helobdella robusta TaxID=6412 RepID=T1G8Z9_HELRO|nr:hypothetical protein HELRODRAFT_94284 [Helobdella robusta]ESO01895.1 hypothetical protein HELRODRAFT_94284 [Helobdella robusta]
MAMDTLSKLALAQITSNNNKNNNGMNMKKSLEPKVLDEESYTANIEKIIERDFFPDLKKMKAQLQYMDAVERKDVQKMWELQQKYSMKRATNTPSTYGTPSTFETPEASILQTPGGTDSRKKTDTTAAAASQMATSQNAEKKLEAPTHNPDPEEARDQELSKLSLNSYMRKYTSEDDKAFSEIMSEAQKRHQMKHAWLYKKEQLQIEDNKDRKQVDTWNYVAKNAVMYVPEGVELSASEKLEMSKLQKQEILHSNTRFATQPFSQVQPDSMNRNNVISNQILKLEGKVGPDGKELLPTETPTINGYKIMPTPSPAPGVDASPFMTWGEIEGTPFRLDGMETPRFGSGSGPNFKIPEVPKRDRLLHQLADKASKAHRAKKMEALKQAAATFSSSPRSFMSRTERLQSLSPAAQRLVSSKLRINSNSSLKASYTPSPCNTPGSEKLTPKMTPKSSDPSPKRKSAKSNENKWNDDSFLTDNLLKLPAKKQKAQDFF